jgi:hypothetical protein
MTSTKNFVTGLTNFALGRYSDVMKRVGTHLSLEDCIKYCIGIVIVCCVFRSREDQSGNLPFPAMDSEEEVINACKLFAEVIKSDTFDVSAYRGPIRKTLLLRIRRELQQHEFEATKSMISFPRLKERCKETIGMFSDVVDIDDYMSSELPRALVPIRGVPPTSTWKQPDDRALMRAFYKYGYERRKRPEAWRIMFADMEMGWTKLWRVENDDDSDDEEEEAGEDGRDTPRPDGGVPKPPKHPISRYKADPDIIHLKRLSSRAIRLIAGLTLLPPPPKEPMPTSLSSSKLDRRSRKRRGKPGRPSRSRDSGDDSDSDDDGDDVEDGRRRRRRRSRRSGSAAAAQVVVSLWSSTEREKIMSLLMRWGLPQFLAKEEARDVIKIPFDVLGGAPPCWNDFAANLPRKSMEMVQERVLSVVNSNRQVVLESGDACPLSKKVLMTRIETFQALWFDVFALFSNENDFFEFLGEHFVGVTKAQNKMPRWWLPAHDLALIRAVCKNGICATWQEVTRDATLFPTLPIGIVVPGEESWDPFPSNKDLNIRFLAVLNWILAAPKLRQYESIVDEATRLLYRERGAELLRPPPLQAMELQRAKPKPIETTDPLAEEVHVTEVIDYISFYGDGDLFGYIPPPPPPRVNATSPSASPSAQESTTASSDTETAPAATVTTSTSSGRTARQRRSILPPLEDLVESTPIKSNPGRPGRKKRRSELPQDALEMTESAGEAVNGNASSFLGAGLPAFSSIDEDDPSSGKHPRPRGRPPSRKTLELREAAAAAAAAGIPFEAPVQPPKPRGKPGRPRKRPKDLAGPALEGEGFRDELMAVEEQHSNAVTVNNEATEVDEEARVGHDEAEENEENFEVQDLESGVKSSSQEMDVSEAVDE